MSANNQPIEVQAREQIAIAVVSLFNWEKQNAASAQASRESAFSNIITLCRAAIPLADADINQVCSTFGAEYLKAGGKPDTIKVRKSELRRIMENLYLITDEVKGWNAAIKVIRNATTPRDERIRDEAEKLLQRLDDTNEELNNLIATYQDTLNDERPTTNGQRVPAYTTEQVATMVRDAIAAKHASAPVQPVNVAQLLRAPANVVAVTQAVMKAAAK